MPSTFRFGHAAGNDWQDAARACLAQLGGPPASLGFLYVTDLLTDHLGEILEFFRQHTGVPHWVGTVGVGICASGHEYHDQPALAVMLGEFAPDSFQVFSGSIPATISTRRVSSARGVPPILRSSMPIPGTTKYRV